MFTVNDLFLCISLQALEFVNLNRPAHIAIASRLLSIAITSVIPYIVQGIERKRGTFLLERGQLSCGRLSDSVELPLPSRNLQMSPNGCCFCPCLRRILTDHPLILHILSILLKSRQLQSGCRFLSRCLDLCHMAVLLAHLRMGATSVFKICSSSLPLPGLAVKNASTFIASAVLLWNFPMSVVFIVHWRTP